VPVDAETNRLAELVKNPRESEPPIRSN